METTMENDMKLCLLTQGFIQHVWKFLIIPQCLLDFLAELHFGKEDQCSTPPKATTP